MANSHQSTNQKSNQNWLKYQQTILRQAKYSLREAYEYTLILRKKKLLSKAELLRGLQSIRSPQYSNYAIVNSLYKKVQHEREDLEHRIMSHICQPSKAANLLKTGQLLELIDSSEVDQIANKYIHDLIYDAKLEHLTHFLSEMVDYQIWTIDKCRASVQDIDGQRVSAINHLCLYARFSDAKKLAMADYHSDFFDLKPSSILESKVKSAEASYLEAKRIVEEKQRQHLAEAQRRQAEEQCRRERAERAAREERLAQKYKDLTSSTSPSNSREASKRQSYQSTIAKRDIKELIHFTALNNVPTILKYGILPRTLLEDFCPNAIINDTERYDGHLDATSLSVSFPNYKMFYKYHQNRDDNWVVLSLNPRLLSDFRIREFYFFPTNAAKKEVDRCSFEEMFKNPDGNNPNDPQAEILAFGIIMPEYISKIYVGSESAQDSLSSLVSSQIPIVINRNYFTYRKGDFQ